MKNNYGAFCAPSFSDYTIETNTFSKLRAKLRADFSTFWRFLDFDLRANVVQKYYIMKILLTLFVLLFSSSVLANSCENWSKLEFRPLEVRDEFKDYNLGVNYIEADAILDTLTDVLVTNFRHFYLSPFFHMGDWEENPENRWGLNYQVCFLTKSMNIISITCQTHIN